jgi:sporulation protein YlmC with PRC-barrel domain
VIRASDLIGCELRTESGQHLGRVHDLRAERAGDDWRLSALVLGRRGISARLVGTGPDPLISGEVIAWEAVTRLEVGRIIVRDGARSMREPSGLP